MQCGKDKYIGFGDIFQKMSDKRADKRTFWLTYGRRKRIIEYVNDLLPYRREIFDALEIIHDA